MTLIRYVLRRFLVAVLNVQIVIALVVMLFATVENLRRHAGSDIGFGTTLRITLLQAPEVLYQVFPLVVMLASLATFLRLARTSELVVLRAAGISALRLIAIPVAAGTLLGILVVAIGNPIVSATIRQGALLAEEARGAGASRLSVSTGGLWLRQGDAGGQTVIRASRANPGGTALNRVLVHRFDSAGQLYARIEASWARLRPGEWVLSDASHWELREDGFARTARGAEIRLPTDLTSEQILDSFSPPEMIPVWELGRFIGQLEEAGFSGLRHRLYFETELAKPLLLAAMVLIGAAFSLRPGRFGQTGVMALLAVLAGFALYFVKDFAETLGASGEVPLRIAAWTPPIAAICLALGLLLHLEDG
ncbi:LPS export ABC transporter permease LptG [soil metagenome]